MTSTQTKPHTGNKIEKVGLIGNHAYCYITLVDSFEMVALHDILRY